VVFVALRPILRPDAGVAGPGTDADAADVAPPAPASPTVPAASDDAAPAVQAPWRAPSGPAARRPVQPDVPRAALDTAKRLSALPPAEREQQLDQMEARREAVAEKINQRVGVLDEKWRKMPPAAREHCLRDYAQRSRQLPPGRRAELMRHVDTAAVERARAARAQQRLDSLKAQGADPKKVAAAKTEVQAATAAQEKAVDDATRVVDDGGFKLDFLSLAEAAIDPAGMVFGSLLDLVDELFTLTFSINFFREEIDSMKDNLKASKEEDRRNDDINEKRELEDLWRQGDELKRRLMSQLGQRYEGRRHEAGKVARGETRK
jgi:hypothetical protein